MGRMLPNHLAGGDAIHAQANMATRHFQETQRHALSCGRKQAISPSRRFLALHWFAMVWNFSLHCNFQLLPAPSARRA